MKQDEISKELTTVKTIKYSIWLEHKTENLAKTAFFGNFLVYYFSFIEKSSSKQNKYKNTKRASCLKSVRSGTKFAFKNCAIQKPHSILKIRKRKVNYLNLFRKRTIIAAGSN